MIESLMNKSDFGTFAKAFTANGIHDSNISDFMIYYAKQRALAVAKRMRSPTNDTQETEDIEIPADVRVDVSVLDGLFDKWYKD